MTYFSPVCYVAYALLPASIHRHTSSAHGKFDGENVSIVVGVAKAAEWLRFMVVGTGVFAHGGVIAAGKRAWLLGCVVVGCVTAMVKDSEGVDWDRRCAPGV